MKTYLVWLKIGTCSYIDADEMAQDEHSCRFIRQGHVVAQYSCRWIDKISDTRRPWEKPAGWPMEECRQRQA